MPRWATTIEVAGVVFTGCRGEILDGQEFLTPYAGSVDWAAEGTPQPQVVNRGVRGIQFGLQMASTEAAKLAALADAVAAAQAAQEAFPVRLVDELYDINVLAHPDYTQRWLAHGRPAEGWVEGVTLRFVAAAEGEA
jgi:hypothetical protein